MSASRHVGEVVDLTAYRAARAARQLDADSVACEADVTVYADAVMIEIEGEPFVMTPTEADALARNLRRAARDARAEAALAPAELVAVLGLRPAVGRIAMRFGVSIDDVTAPELEADTAVIARVRAEVWALLQVSRAQSFGDLAKAWGSTPARVRASVKRLAKELAR